MRFTIGTQRTWTNAIASGLIALALPQGLAAQKDIRPPAASQGFDGAECRSGCVLDTLTIDVDRSRRAQPGSVTATLILIDTVAVAKRGAPPAPRERSVPVSVTCDSTPCAAAMVSARLADKRLDDARVVRRAVVTWLLPPQLLQKLLRASSVSVMVDGRVHALTEGMVSATRTLVESVRTTIGSSPYSARAQLYVASFVVFGIPGDSTMAEDVGTATEPLMIPDAATSAPTRVATLTLVGRGAEASALLVQEDGTGAAPIFGVAESVTILLPGRSGRRGVVTGKVLARQRVEGLRDACLSAKVWTYLVSLSPADLSATQRGVVPSPRPGDGIDRWSGAAVREAIAVRMTPAEQRSVAATRSVVAQFVRERASTGVRDRDVQVLAAFPKGAGFVTNFGVFARDGAGGWHFPGFTLRPAACP